MTEAAGLRIHDRQHHSTNLLPTHKFTTIEFDRCDGSPTRCSQHVWAALTRCYINNQSPHSVQHLLAHNFNNESGLEALHQSEKPFIAKSSLKFTDTRR